MKNRTRIRRMLAAGTAVLVGAALALPLGAMPAQAAVTSVLDVRKTASVTEVQPGDTFQYTVQVSCSAITSTGCEGAVLTDPVPAPFVPISAAVTGAPALQPVIAPDGTVTVTFNADLGDGTTGLRDSTTGVVTITVQTPDPLPYDLNGVPISNTATATASNADPKSQSADVTPVVELDLASETTKQLDPASGVAAAGTDVTAVLGGTNTSNGSVDRLVISDPADPTAVPSPFDLLDLVSIDSVTYPTGADTAVLSYWDGADWVAGPPAMAPDMPTGPPAPPAAEAGGFRIEFTNSSGEATIPAGAQGGVQSTLEQGAAVDGLTEPVTVQNTAGTVVGRGDAEQESTASDDYRIVLDPVVVGADKSFHPEAVIPGDSSEATLVASNDGELPLDTMTITEPSAAADGFFDSAAFDGFTAPIGWPDGADTATLTYVYSDGSDSGPLPLAPGVDAPAATPPPGATVAGFTIVYTSTSDPAISPGATAEVKFGVIPDASLDAPLDLVNEFRVDGTADGNTGSASDDATLHILKKVLVLETTKKLSPGQILAVPGELVTVQLPTTLLSPESTTGATEIVVQDPQTVPDPGWWNAFDVYSITKTDIPPGATLSINYWSVEQQAWVPLPGAQDVTTPNPFSMVIDPTLRDDIGGLQFVFDKPAPGFPPGTTVQPNFTSELRSEYRDGSGSTTGSDEPVSVPNCASASATGDAGVDPGSATTPEPCPAVEIIPTSGDGSGDLIDKEWVDPVPPVVIARSGEQATARLHWSTGGYSNLDQVVVADAATPPADDAAVAASVFQAFDLVKVQPITADPWLQYDQVVAVQLWNGSAWVDTETNPCAGGACQGAFPGYTLTPAERASTTSVRLVFEEYDVPREASDAPIDAPPPATTQCAEEKELT
ncbi:hypothetical protein ACWKWP_17200 [Agromyces soli]